MTPKSLPPLHRSFTDAIAEFYHGEWTFTGTRKGMNDIQQAHVRQILTAGAPLVLRHGGAVGSDTEMHAIWRECRLPGIVDVWPSDVKRRDVFAGQAHVRLNPIMEPLLRNVEMVKRAQFVFGTPHLNRQTRSGTWHTLGYAMSRKVPTLIVWPDGKFTLYHQNSLQRLVTEDFSSGAT